MILPIYAWLERMDMRLIEAAKDLYRPRRPGVPQGDAAALDAWGRRGHAPHLHPRPGDYVNAQFLGGAGNRMIGNVIQSLYLTQSTIRRRRRSPSC